MRTRSVTYSVTIFMILVMPVVRYFSSTPGVNACVIEYVDNLPNSEYSGYMYNIDGLRHIEPKNSVNNESLKEYRVGKSYGCLMVSDNPFVDLNNSIYCSMVFLIKKAPVNPIYKEPMRLLKN